MSAYMASPPVTARKAAPRIAKETAGPAWTMKPTAAQGFTASRIAGAFRMPWTPSTASSANQASITGPKMRPMEPVPKRCARNSPMSTTIVMGSTKDDSAGASTFRPSTADSTEMAGVIAPSP